MKILSFDCSTTQGSLAVLEEGNTVFAEAFACPRGRGGEFFEVLERAIRTCGKPDRIVVGIGPGSYNGLRTAISAGEGLRIATGAELVGVASVRALPCETGDYAAVNDARGGVYYYVELRGRRLIGEFELLKVEDLAARLDPAHTVFASAPSAALPQARVAYPDAVLLAQIGADELPEAGNLEPLYLKPAHITQPKKVNSPLVR